MFDVAPMVSTPFDGRLKCEVAVWDAGGDVMSQFDATEVGCSDFAAELVRKCAGAVLRDLVWRRGATQC